MANTIDILGDEQTAALLISRTITEFVDDVLTSVGNYAFYNCIALTSVSLPNVTSIGSNVFQYCNNLTNINLPLVTSLDVSTFRNCTSLVRIDLPAVMSIYDSVFRDCTNLTTVILRTNQVAILSNTNAFTNADNAIIYVPDTLVGSYKVARNWNTYASRIKGISELPAA